MKRIDKLDRQSESKPTANNIYPKEAVQWLNQALRFVSSLVLIDILALRNAPEHQALKPYCISDQVFRKHS